MSRSSIEWCTDTWNPLRARAVTGRVGWHCEKISPGCAHCYAERFNGRMLPAGGTGQPYVAAMRKATETFLDSDVLEAPLRWKKPRIVFVCSMTDIFGEWVERAQLDRLFAVMALARQHYFLVLTKRSAAMRSYLENPTKHERWSPLISRLSDKYRRSTGGVAATWWPEFSRNIGIGVSVEDQKTAEERIPELLATPAAMRFVSYEPALGPVDLSGHGGIHCSGAQGLLDWIIVGGESGPGARPFDLAWARSTIAQCRSARVACFVKQLGSRWAKLHGPSRVVRCGPNRARAVPRDSKGGTMELWPEDLRVREFPEAMHPYLESAKR